MSEHRAALRRGRWIVAAGLAVLLALAGWKLLGGSDAAEPPRHPAANAAVPVTAARAVRQDFPVFLSGIGTVQALNSVLVRARVDGALESVNFTEGQMVKKGQLLAVIDPRPYQAALAQAEGALAHDQAALLQAQSDLKRYQKLLRQDSISRQQAENQRFQVMQYQGSIATDQANINTAKLNVMYCHIESPVDGRVGLRLVDPGNMVRATDTNGLVTVNQVHPITAVFTLPEDDLPRVVAGMRAGRVTVMAYSSDHKTRLAEGRLLTPDNAIDTASGTIKLKAEFPNKDDRLWPGQFIDARVEVALLREAVTVPDVAVERGANGLYVYVVKPDSTVVLRPVEVTVEQDGLAVIAKGVAGGETVVTNGQSRLADGIRVSPRLTTASAAEHPGSGG